jgi:hypothetical protein
MLLTVGPAAPLTTPLQIRLGVVPTFAGGAAPTGTPGSVASACVAMSVLSATSSMSVESSFITGTVISTAGLASKQYLDSHGDFMSTSITQVDAGTVVRFYTSEPFANFDGTPVDPTEVVFAFRVAGGTTYQTTYGSSASWGTIVKDGVGLYHIDIDTTGLPGIWEYVWASSGTVQTRSEMQLTVVTPSIAITL